MLLLLQQNMLLGDAPTLVPVPDVVGETQAAGTATLEGDLFVVAVATAYSSTVAAGLIISTSPAAGVEAVEGSTVTITVSLGEAPVQDTQSGGGWWPDYEHVRRAREKRRREIEEAEEATRQLQDETDRQIAALLREQEARDAERADLQRLQKLADRYSGQKLGLPKPVSTALINAYEARTKNSLQQLRREVERANEDEEMAFIVSLLMMD